MSQSVMIKLDHFSIWTLSEMVIETSTQITTFSPHFSTIWSMIAHQDYFVCVLFLILTFQLPFIIFVLFSVKDNKTTN